MEERQILSIQEDILNRLASFKQLKKIESGYDLQEAIRDHNVTHMRLLWTSINGCLQSQEMLSEHLDMSEDNKFTIDGSSFPNWQDIHESDLYLKPDFKTAFIDPLNPQIINIFTTVYTPNGELYEKCPRATLEKAQKYLEASSIRGKAFFGPEPEFYLVDSIAFENQSHESGFRIHDHYARWNSKQRSAGSAASNGAYMAAGVNDHNARIRETIEIVLNKAGVKITKGHTEVGGLQHELGLEVDHGLSSADSLQLYRMYVKRVAALFDKHATFIPKLISGENGNGMHVHMSIQSEGKNLFAGENLELSEKAYCAMNGILQNANVFAAMTNPSVVSYKRLIPGFEAPNALVVSKSNRSAGIRIPAFYSEKASRFEVRWGDPIANPYFMFSSFILAMMDGIERGEKDVKMIDYDLFENEDLIKKDKVQYLVDSLYSAVRSMEGNIGFFTDSGVFTENSILSYIEKKKHELQFMKETITHADIEYVEHHYSR